MKKKYQNTSLCPCQWHENVSYAQCCGQYINAESLPDDAETLMRSRYSAYVKEEEAYLRQTWHPSTRPEKMDFEPTQWLRLKVHSHQIIDDTHATVEFSAHYKINGKAHVMQENSRFIKEHGQWFYVDGDVEH